MKKYLLFGFLCLFSIAMIGCKKDDLPIDDLEKSSPCRDNPLSSECFALDDLNLKEETPADEYVFSEDFESDYRESSPLSWLLYRNDMYEIKSVSAVVKGDESNQYVSLYCDGKKGPLYYPIDRSLIFTRAFNLDYSDGGYAETDIYLPEEVNNDVYFEIATGAVAVIGIKINKKMEVSVVTGGQFNFYSVAPEVYQTKLILNTNTWYRLRLSWNVKSEIIGAYLVEAGELVELYEGPYHRSTRYSALVDGAPIPPNIVRFSMPKLITSNGYAYIDNVVVKREETK